jgi:hypothetical protein
MHDLSILFNSISRLANQFDGAEGSYQSFMKAALAFEQAGGTPEQIDTLLDLSIRAADRLFSAPDDTAFVTSLEAGGAQILRHGSVFVKPTLTAAMPGVVGGRTRFAIQPYEPKLQGVVQALHKRGVYFDDLVLDVGRVSGSQMRTYPYVVITIPRLNAQIAVSNQRGQAIFVAQPAIPIMDWAVFDKQSAGVPGTAFSHVKRIVCTGAWQDKMLDWVFGTAQAAGAKVSLPGYVRSHRNTPYPLSEDMIVAMARLYRARHPDRQWPAQASGVVDEDIVTTVTGDPDWQRESWSSINTAASQNLRGLKDAHSLSAILRKHGCYYRLTEEMIVAIATMWRERHPDRKWPDRMSGEIPHDIVVAVTGDPLWQKENWMAIDSAGVRAGRGLTRKANLLAILQDHRPSYDLSKGMIIAMATMCRDRHPDGKWPHAESGEIPADIVTAVTGVPDWPAENWGGLDRACRKAKRGMTEKLSLARLLQQSGCHYDKLTEEAIVAMAVLWRDRDPQGRLPTKNSGPIPRDIVARVMGDPHWQPETWMNINALCKIAGRGLQQKTSLSQLWDKHFPDRSPPAPDGAKPGTPASLRHLVPRP